MIFVDDVWKNYGRHGALRGLNLMVARGSVLALLGANGAGKTTLIRTIVNMIEPDRGAVTVLAVDSRRLGPTELWQIGFVSENQRLPERLTVAQFLSYLRPLYPAWDRALEQDLLTQLELPPRLRIGGLSHGMKMKLRLAAALSFHPKLLILDEPLSGLDPLARDEFIAAMGGRAGGTTILISSHELHEIDGLATDIAYIDRGRLIFQEPVRDLQARVREIRVTLPDSPACHAAPPAHWLDLRTGDGEIRFVDTEFSEAGLADRLAAYFGPIHNIEVTPLGLRPIFTAIARSLRENSV